MRYQTFRSKKQLRAFSIFLPGFLTLICIAVFWLIDDIIVRLFMILIHIILLLFCIGVFRVAKDTYLQINDESVSWSGILAKVPKAHIPLSDIVKVYHIKEKWIDYNTQVVLTLCSGVEYIVPVPNDDTYSFFEAISVAAPHANSSTRLGSVESPWRYVRQAIFNRNHF